MTPRWVVYDEPAGGGTWDPSQLSTLAAWYDADAITGLNNNDPVSTWSDSSSSGYDASSSGSDRPTYITNAQNGLPVVRFSGSNHLNLGSTDLFRNVGGGTVYGLLKPSSSVRGLWLTVTKPPSNPSFSRVQVETGFNTGSADVYRSGGRRLDSDSFAAVLSASVVTTQWIAFGAVFDWLNAELKQYLDGQLDGADLSFQTPGLTSDTATIASGTNIGAAATDNHLAWQGDIAEIVIAHTATPADRQRLEGYLAHRWGLAGNLPVSHPYKNAAP